MTRQTIVFWLLVAVAALLVFIGSFRSWSTPRPAPANQSENTNTDPYQAGTVTSFDQVTADIFESSAPAHNAILVQSPNVVTVTFSEPLQPSSNLTVLDSSDRPSQLGPATFSEDRRTMSVLLRGGLSGPVHTAYQACRLDMTCQSGRFSFVIRPLPIPSR